MYVLICTVRANNICTVLFNNCICVCIFYKHKAASCQNSEKIYIKVVVYKTIFHERFYFWYIF